MFKVVEYLGMLGALKMIRWSIYSEGLDLTVKAKMGQTKNVGHYTHIQHLEVVD